MYVRFFFSDSASISNETTRHINVLRGSDILIPCNISGYPVPYVTWTKNGSKFSSNKRQKVTTDGLRIVDFNVSDIGNYTCTARNILGMDNNSISVDIIKT